MVIFDVPKLASHKRRTDGLSRPSLRLKEGLNKPYKQTLMSDLGFFNYAY